jgi:hypothetical protein
MNEASGVSGGFYMHGHLRKDMLPSPFQQPEESSPGALAGPMGRQVGSQGQYGTGADNLQVQHINC